MTKEVAATGDFVLRGGRILDPSQGVDAVDDLWVSDGRIAGISTPEFQTGVPPGEGAVVIDATGMVICPGLVDIHCHLREPGFEHKETIATGARAAARGGFTTICCMPNTSPPIDSRAVVDFVFERARQAGMVRVFPIGCVTQGQEGQSLAEMAELAEAGVVGFSDDGKPVATSRLMRHALEYARPLGLPVIDHCEDLTLSEGGAMNEGRVATRLGLKGIPAAAEEIIVARDIALARLTRGRLHIAHVSTAGSVALIRRAKEEGLAITAEVTPHHLTLTEDWVLGPGAYRAGLQPAELGPIPCLLSLQPYDTATKVNPPLRTEADRRALVEGLRDGTIDAIATDHAPHDVVSKGQEYDLAPVGISGFETALAALLALVHRGELDLGLLIAKLTVGPAAIIGKPLGTLKVGANADIAVFDPDALWDVNPTQFASKGKNTPLAGCMLRGQVAMTIVDGKVVYNKEAV